MLFPIARDACLRPPLRGRLPQAVAGLRPRRPETRQPACVARQRHPFRSPHRLLGLGGTRCAIPRRSPALANLRSIARGAPPRVWISFFPAPALIPPAHPFPPPIPSAARQALAPVPPGVPASDPAAAANDIDRAPWAILSGIPSSAIREKSSQCIRSVRHSRAFLCFLFKEVVDLVEHAKRVVHARFAAFFVGANQNQILILFVRRQHLAHARSGAAMLLADHGTHHAADALQNVNRGVVPPRCQVPRENY